MDKTFSRNNCPTWYVTACPDSYFLIEIQFIDYIWYWAFGVNVHLCKKGNALSAINQRA
jgi:hypothetical protein